MNHTKWLHRRNDRLISKFFKHFQVTFDLVLRIMNRKWNPQFTSRESQEFNHLADEVINAVRLFFFFSLSQFVAIFSFYIFEILI